jgi:hypothetical protein
MAFTAAVCSENFIVGLLRFKDQMHSWLSLPPDASCRLSGDHLSPHTSDLCAEHLQHVMRAHCDVERTRACHKNCAMITDTFV